MIKKKNLKEHLDTKGMRTAGKLADALEVKVKEMLEEAILKALKDKRKTVTPKDLD